MTSEIRSNTLKNRVGLGTISFTNTGAIVSGIVTANSFSGPISGTTGTFSGNVDINGDLDVDGTTNLDHVYIAGVSTFIGRIRALATGDNQGIRLHTNSGVSATGNFLRFNTAQSNGFSFCQNSNGTSSGERFRIAGSGNVSIFKDLDVDGHTNLDNVSVAGVSTFATNVDIDGSTTFGGFGAITSAADFNLSSNGLVITGSQTVVEARKAGDATIQCTDTTNNTNLQLRANSDGGLVRTANNKPLVLGTNQVEILRITSGGQVGIGITNPGAELQVYHATSNTIAQFESGDASAVVVLKDNSTYSSIDQNGTDFIIHADPGASHANSALSFKVDGDEKLRIASDGNSEFKGDVTIKNPGGVSLFSLIDANNNALHELGTPGNGDFRITVDKNDVASSQEFQLYMRGNDTADLAFHIDHDRNVDIPNGTLKVGTTGDSGAKIQIGNHTFDGTNFAYNNTRVGFQNNGSLTCISNCSTYNDATYPGYGVVLVQGANTSSYNVWSISPDGPAKGNSLNLHYGAQATNIHVPSYRKFQFTGDGYFMKPAHPCFDANRTAGPLSATSVIVYNQASLNNGNHYDTSNGRFTAPITGIYQFWFGAIKQQTSSVVRIQMRKNGTGSYIANGRQLRLDSHGGGAGEYGENGAVTLLVSLIKDEYVEVLVTSGTVYGSGADYTYFCGTLIG